MSDPNAPADDFDDDFEWDEDAAPAASTPTSEDDAVINVSDASTPVSTGVLADGSAAVILAGPGAGTQVTRSPHSENQSEVRLRSRDAALSPGVPLFLVHRPHQKADLMPRLLAGVVGTTAGAVSAGASAALPAASDQSIADWLASCAAASVKLADPAAFFKDPTIVRVPPISPRARTRRPYLLSPLDVAADLIELQRTVGANLFLTAGRALDPTAPQPSLDAAFAHGDDMLSELRPGERLALNLTLPATWLTSSTLRAKLFAQLLDQEQFDVWHIRVQWSSSLRSLTQPVTADLLTGYKRLAQLAADEGRVLLLPQTGLTGWVQLAFGAHGFGSGLFGSGQAFKEHSQGGAGGQPEIERYFEPTLLHTVERAVYDAMRSKPGYVLCDCPYCPALRAKADWDHTLARLHFMHWQGRLAGVGPATGKTQEAAIRRIVRTAVAAAAAQPLASISLPRHLAVWDQLL